MQIIRFFAIYCVKLSNVVDRIDKFPHHTGQLDWYRVNLTRADKLRVFPLVSVVVVLSTMWRFEDYFNVIFDAGMRVLAASFLD